MQGLEDMRGFITPQEQLSSFSFGVLFLGKLEIVYPGDVMVLLSVWVFFYIFFLFYFLCQDLKPEFALVLIVELHVKDPWTYWYSHVHRAPLYSSSLRLSL